jgi:hypothetical protein
MKLKKLILIIFVCFTSLIAKGQSMTYTFVDPCTKEVTHFSIPIQGQGTLIFFLGQQQYFTANDVASGAFANWVNQAYTEYRKVSPCGVQQGQVTQNQITAQLIGSTIQSVMSSIMSQAKSESSSNVSTDGGSDAASKGGSNSDKKNKKQKNGDNTSNGSGNNSTNSGSTNGSNGTNNGNQQNTQNNTTTNSSTNSTTGSSTNPTTNSTTSSSNSNNNTGGSTSSGNGTSNGNGNSGSSSSDKTNGSTGGQTSNQSGGQTNGQSGSNNQNNTTENKGNEVVGSTAMNVDARQDRGTESSSSSGGGKKSGNSNSKTNPLIISSDLTNAQNLDKSFTGIINIGTSKSSLTGTSSWGVTSMVWFNLKQFALSGRYTKIHYSKDRKLKLIHNLNLTGVYSYGNYLGFLGYSAILNAGKWGVTGGNISGAITKTPDDQNLFISPSITAFYTRPFKAGSKIIISPELYIISTPLVYSSVDRVSVSDRTFSAFIGTGFDYQITKRFKVNFNYKLNMSTNPSFPVLSFFLIGSKINL